MGSSADDSRRTLGEVAGLSACLAGSSRTDCGSMASGGAATTVQEGGKAPADGAECATARQGLCERTGAGWGAGCQAAPLPGEATTPWCPEGTCVVGSAGGKGCAGD